MSSRLKEVTAEEMKGKFPAGITLKDAQSAGEPIFEVKNTVKPEEPDPLVKIEITLRKGKRVGLFEE